MSRLSVWLCALAASLVFATGAAAAPKPNFGPPPKWVEVLPIPEPPAAEGAAAIQTLLDDNQSRLGPDVDAYYNRRVRRVLKPEGLAAMTTFGVTWDPDHETVTVHSLKIIRGGKTIDLLNRGKDMLVLRRERDLERAMLDGRMSATQQLSGVQVGDVIDMAWTTAGRDPVAAQYAYDSEGLAFPGVAARYRVRISFPEGAPVKWKPTPGFPEPKVTTRDGRTWLDVDARSVSAPKPPVGAPARFRRLGMMETSGYQSWRDISRLMAPLYAKASALGADSAVRAEAQAIAARTKDPAERAFEALRLVEDKTRYFFVGMGDGGYVPAHAEETWTRRFGDCKGKTALLLALLNELGVEAQPALVSLGGGDGMDERLPSLAAFNHVIVRATVGGKVYWLDGTRTGDRSGLAALRPPPHHWALPVSAAGADLERIHVPPLDSPMLELTMRYDASGGLDRPAAVDIRQRYRGDAANRLRQVSAATPRADLERNLRQGLSSMNWVTVDQIDWVDDTANDAFEVRVKGKADLQWRLNQDVNMREYRVSVAGGQTPSFPRREPGLNQDAPFAVGYPNYVRSVTEFVLPAAGKGYVVRGPNSSDTVAGVELKRTSGLEGGVARFVQDVRSVKPEITPQEAEEATRVMRRLALDDSLIRAPL